MLYRKQKKLLSALEEQVYENEKNNSMMINILAHITVHLRVVNNKYTGVLFRRIIHIIPPLQIIVIGFYYQYI
jgi:hypothetical protein